jgi:hypothetical protein
MSGILYTKSHPYLIPLLLGIDKPSRQDYIETLANKLGIK